MEENRRVEITSSTLALLDPVTTNDTLRTVDPPILRLKTNVTAEAGAAGWRIVLTQGNRELKEFSGSGAVPGTLEWNIPEVPGRIPLRSDPVIATLVLSDTRGAQVQATDQAQVEQVTIRRKREERIGDIVYERFNLIVFEFDKATLSAGNLRTANLIKGRIGPASEVEIIGYTDRIGEDQHNLELSRQRALNTARTLGVPAENARGAGENTTMYDNDLPEGRFLSRTVDVTVKTRVEGE